jgi:hypothetical protein
MYFHGFCTIKNISEVVTVLSLNLFVWPEFQIKNISEVVTVLSLNLFVWPEFQIKDISEVVTVLSLNLFVWPEFQIKNISEVVTVLSLNLFVWPEFQINLSLISRVLYILYSGYIWYQTLLPCERWYIWYQTLLPCERYNPSTVQLRLFLSKGRNWYDHAAVYSFEISLDTRSNKMRIRTF